MQSVSDEWLTLSPGSDEGLIFETSAFVSVHSNLSKGEMRRRMEGEGVREKQAFLPPPPNLSPQEKSNTHVILTVASRSKSNIYIFGKLLLRIFLCFELECA